MIEKKYMKPKDLNPTLLSTNEEEYSKLNNQCDNSLMAHVYDSTSENSIYVQKENGTDVLYYIFKNYEIHLNNIHGNSVQEWHAHEKIEEVILVIKGSLLIEWRQGINTKSLKAKEKSIITVENSIHHIINQSDEECEFVVFRKLKEDNDIRDIFKTDKVIFK